MQANFRLIFAISLILGGSVVLTLFEDRQPGAQKDSAKSSGAAVAAALQPATTHVPPAMVPVPKEGTKKVDFLFVQTAKGMTFDSSTSNLTLQGVSPITVFFSDRPERIAGNMKTDLFLSFWGKGKDSFFAVAPNADISLLEGDKLLQTVVTLEDPVLEGDTLTYTVKVLHGEMPAKADDVSVFIDIIGMPMTPVSYAGVARRSYARAYYYH
ncbi:MAG TPA: hypothetical protein VJS64_05000 [Pyrinomonadaceae bacterium]|nr:hypothetical protein [Pyrinomonadaceae bacterium]